MTGTSPGSGAGLAGRVTAVAGMTGGFLPSAGRPLIGRRTGQSLALHELAEISIWHRILDWLARLVSNSVILVPSCWFGLIALTILSVLAITALVYWLPTVTCSR